MQDIDLFLHRLALTDPPPNCHNPYLRSTACSAARTHNLSRYLTVLAAEGVEQMLVGEAPGYRGARLTGIPFVSPALLAEPAVAPGFFGNENRFQSTAEWPHIQREASATMMWGVIAACRPLPLLWNAFPFHPFRPGNPQSNRPPTRAELATGLPFLQQLHAIFGQPQLVAVGKKAAQSLAGGGWTFVSVRHPSHGGKKAFTRKLQELCR